MEIEISKIIIPNDRQRQTFDPEKMQELINSINENGLYYPIIIDENDKLIDGERRVRAFTLLEKTTIRFERFEGLPEWKKEVIQLETNIKREALLWQEEVNAKLRIHELYQKQYGEMKRGERKMVTVEGEVVGGWGIKDTAEKFGESHSLMGQDINLARAMKDDPNLSKKDSKIAARKALKVKTELAMKQEIAAVFAGVAKAQGESPIQIILGDSREILKGYDEESFDFCITDPPYSIGMHDIQNTFPNRGDVRQGIEFDDSKDILENTIKPVMTEVFRILKPDSHCYIFFAIARYTEIRAILEGIGFWVCPTPLFWVKNNALNLRPHIMYPINYEPIFYCSKSYPPRPLSSIQTRSTFEHSILSGMTKSHPAEKPIPLLRWLITNCSQPKERGIDPFLGGGSFTKTCQGLDRLAVGIELDETWWLAAKQKLEEEKDVQIVI
jgi:DNA modification methylase